MPDILSTTTISVAIDGLLPFELQALVDIAHLEFGYKRENPRKKWTQKERKQFARFAVRNLVAHAIRDKLNTKD